jgi:hypothetical protein
MSSKLTVAALGALAGLMSQPAWSAQRADETTGQAALAQCIALNTTGADRLLTARWLFAMLGKSSQIADLSTADAGRENELNKGFAKLFTRIVTKDCTAEVRPLAAADLTDAFGKVGEALGETAMNELMNDNVVEKALGEYAEFISDDDFKPFIDSLPKKLK